jgi:thioredoxin 1
VVVTGFPLCFNLRSSFWIWVRERPIKGEKVQEICCEAQFDDFIHDHPAAALWFSTADCGVCHVLLPKVAGMLEREFPRVVLARVDCAVATELAAAQGVSSIPALLLCFDGRETQRFVRNFSLGQVRDALARPYNLLFE